MRSDLIPYYVGSVNMLTHDMARAKGSYKRLLLFFITKIKGFFVKSKHKIKYPNLHSAMRPVSHNDELLVPETPENFTYGDAAGEIDKVESSFTSSEINYVSDVNEEPHLNTPSE
ncbi:hypothetical protein AVEN_197798-1 [Araneus ventricosus]|uniref:Uncharacterized protein n=1 Tax=Araneus ventricosus TaxID=182803 RepID=A0A4Y2HLZ9_ARAVE|nr:hypothetical protein AVEN_197798-1 [Araneus ventricosus]